VSTMETGLMHLDGGELYPSDIVPSNLQNIYWRQKDRQLISIQKMDDQHLRNTALMLIGMGYQAYHCPDRLRVLWLTALRMEASDTEEYARIRAERKHARGNKHHRCGSSIGCIRVDKIPERLTRIRNDETKTAARYDEIIALRMLLMDINDAIDESGMFPDVAERLKQKIVERAKRWGKKGDCV
jgi:hypothetical protein